MRVLLLLSAAGALAPDIIDPKFAAAEQSAESAGRQTSAYPAAAQAAALQKKKERFLFSFYTCLYNIIV